MTSEYSSSGMHKSLVCENDNEAWNTATNNENPVNLYNDNGEIRLTERYDPQPKLIKLGEGAYRSSSFAYWFAYGFRCHCV